MLFIYISKMSKMFQWNKFHKRLGKLLIKLNKLKHFWLGLKTIILNGATNQSASSVVRMETIC